MDSCRYRPGDRVMVRDDLNIAKYYNNIGVTNQMLEFRGKQVVISQKVKRYEHCYRIIEDDGNWVWTDDMFCEIPYEEVDDEEDFKLLYEEFVNGNLFV